MDGQKLRDAANRGMGTSARLTGMPYRVYRPSGFLPPLCEDFVRSTIYARFTPQATQGSLENRLKQALWHGIFDASFTRLGDYLVGRDGIFFISSLNTLESPLCIRANTNFSFYAPAAPGLNSYSGFQIETATQVSRQWPAFLDLQSAGNALAVTASSFGVFNILLPASLPDLDAGLVAVDAAGRCYLVTSIEHGNAVTVMKAAAYSA